MKKNAFPFVLAILAIVIFLVMSLSSKKSIASTTTAANIRALDSGGGSCTGPKDALGCHSENGFACSDNSGCSSLTNE
jgi:hypothetical protein